MHVAIRVAVLLVLSLLAGGQARAEIALGFANPLSGPFAATGARNLLAAMLAVDHINAEGGVIGQDVRLVVADDGCGFEAAVDAAETLVRAEVAATIGHFCSHSSLLAAAVYDVADIVMITPDSTHPRLTEEGRHNVFRLIGRDDRQGAIGAERIVAAWPGRRIAVLDDGSTYGAGLAGAVRRGLERRDANLALAARYVPDRAAYPDLVQRLDAADVDVLYVAGYGPDAGRIIADARARGLTLELVGGDGLGMHEFWTVAGRAGEGAIFSSVAGIPRTPPPGEVDAPDRTALRLFEGGGSGAYAAVQLWRQAVERAGAADLARVEPVLRRGRFETLRGTVAFDDKGDLEGAAWTWQVWRNGRIEPLD